jgi:predicted acylesterase/phospholipase RssA
MFIVLVNLRRKIFKLKPLGELHESLEPGKKVVPVINLPNTTRKILVITTILVSILLILITIAPIQTTENMGDGVTVLIMCFCIWLPLLYWVRYFSLRLGFPLYLIIAVIIISFSFFNSNKNIRLLSNTTKTDVNIGDYTESWLQKVKNLENRNEQSDSRTPMVIVLSEGGGIRAAYWSAQFLARTQRDYPNFRDYLFCISGVSGGSFGATVFDGVLNYYDLHPQELEGTDLEEKSVIQNKITDIIGKDYLSPTIACLGSREIIQLLIPFPIQSFDRAKVFEETWEYIWKEELNKDSTFSKSFLSLWDNKAIPPVFLNATQVETGYPVVLSNIRLNAELPPKDFNNSANQSDFHLPRDFYTDILVKPSVDVSLSTASLLSARFPFVSPAGTIIEKNGGTISLVDGGYFDNTGANTAYQVLFNIKKIYEKKGRSIYRTDIKPVIVYLTNGIHIPDKIGSSKTMLDQLAAPIETSMQIRDSNTKNNLLKLMDFVDFYDGEFITYSLPKPGDKQTDIPLGWALSSKTQKEIDDRVQEIDIKELGKHIK